MDEDPQTTHHKSSVLSDLDELLKLKALLDSGGTTPQEYEELKRRILER